MKSNKKLLTGVIIAIFVILYPLVQNSSGANNPNEEDVLKTILALNYCQIAVCSIISYNDKIILEKEYDNIINNIDFTVIYIV